MQCKGRKSRHNLVAYCLGKDSNACSLVLLEKLTGLQLVKKFPTFYGTRRFIAAFTCARHLSLSWASTIQSLPPHPTSWRSILALRGRTTTPVLLYCTDLGSSVMPKQIYRFFNQNVTNKTVSNTSTQTTEVKINILACFALSRSDG
jgi:hypothetical protein